MQRLSIYGLVATVVAAMPIAARAIECDPGYYPGYESDVGSVCWICADNYYCPDGVNHVKCPDPEYGETHTYNNELKNSNRCTQAQGCCIHYSMAYTSAHGSGTIRCYWSDSAQSYSYSCHLPNLQKCDAGYYKDTSLSSGYPYNCYPVGVGYYSPADSIDREPCPTGYTTPETTTMATSADECTVCADGYGMHNGKCEKLCTAGATMLHVGPHTFNLYPDSACERPAIHIGLPNGTCCAHLEKGEVSGALHVRYNDTVYHTTN